MSEVRAAGGVVVRDGRVLAVHRPKYDDWSLPKGHLDKGETFEQAAAREVEEETGFACALGDELEPVRYTDRKGRPKVVRYWRMTVTGGEWTPNDEVDEIGWLTADEAATLTHDADRRLLIAGLRGA